MVNTSKEYKMNDLIENEISKMFSMQKDLLSDGECPVPFTSNQGYYIEMMVHCEELSTEMATILVKEMTENMDEFIITKELIINQ